MNTFYTAYMYTSTPETLAALTFFLVPCSIVRASWRMVYWHSWAHTGTPPMCSHSQHTGLVCTLKTCKEKTSKCDVIWSIEAKVAFSQNWDIYRAELVHTLRNIGPNPSSIAYSWTKLQTFDLWLFFCFSLFFYLNFDLYLNFGNADFGLNGPYHVTSGLCLCTTCQYIDHTLSFGEQASKMDV